MAKKEKKKPVDTTEKIMNIWAKISSIIIVPILLMLVILMPGVFIENFSNGMGALFLSVLIILFYLPLIYYAWFKKPNKNWIKVFAKITTFLVAVGTIWNLVVDKDSKLPLEALIFYAPVFYYAWKK